MPIVATDAVLLAKIQPVADTYVEPAATDWVEITDVTLTPMESEAQELKLVKAAFGANPQRFYGHRVKLSFSIALAGSGTAGTAPYWGVIERICGMAQTIVATTSVKYMPADSAHEMGSMVCFIGKNKHALKNARGTSTLEVSKGGFLVRRYDITGIYIDPVEATVPTIVFTPRVMPELLLAENTALTLHGAANLCLQSLSIDTGFDIKFKTFLNCKDSVGVDGRMAKGSIEVLAESVAVKDWFAVCKSGTTDALSFKLNNGGAAGKRLEIAAPKVQLSNPQYGEADGLKTLKMDMTLLPNAGSDDYSLINA